MFLRCNITAIALSAAIALSPNSTQAAEAGPEGPPQDLETFLQRAEALLEEHEGVGAGLALMRDGELVYAGGVGLASLEPERPVTADTVFRIGSVTKMVVALSVMRLVEQGRLSLADPVLEHLPDAPIDNPWSDTDPVRVVHLLEHTAGFDDMHFRNMNLPEGMDAPADLDAVLSRLDQELQVRWRPGQRHSYSNPGYALAGKVVEAVTGEAFHHYADREVLGRLGIEPGRWQLGGVDGPIALGYADGAPAQREDILLYPAGSLTLSSTELARVLALFLGRGELDGERLISADSIERMERPETTAAARAGIVHGYGLGNFGSIRAGRAFSGHDGGIDGFISSLGYQPENGYGYVVLLNTLDGALMRDLKELAADYLTGTTAVEAAPMETVAPDAAIEGCYRMANSRNQLFRGVDWLFNVGCFNVDGDQVVLSHPLLPQTETFEAVGDGRQLRGAEEPVVRNVFIPDVEGRRAVAVGNGLMLATSWASAALPLYLALLIVLGLVFALLHTLYWAPLAAFRKLEPGTVAVRAWPSLFAISLTVMLVTASSLGLADLTGINAKGITLFVTSVLLPLFAVLGFSAALRTWDRNHGFVRWQGLLISIGAIILSGYFYIFHWIGLRLWAW